MIAKNYIRFPEALRYQVEMFSNGYHNSPRIMRLMQVMFDWKPTVPEWFKKAAERSKALARRWKLLQLPLIREGFYRSTTGTAPRDFKHAQHQSTRHLIEVVFQENPQAFNAPDAITPISPGAKNTNSQQK